MSMTFKDNEGRVWTVTIDVAAGERHAADAGKGGATTTTREPCSATTVGAMSSATSEVKMQEGRRIDR